MPIDMNKIREECIKICEKCEIIIDFSAKNWIENFKLRINWDKLSKHCTLSENFIEYFQDYVNWNYISINQKLTEPFMEKFKDKIDWLVIPIHQNLSQLFIIKFKDKFDLDILFEYQYLSHETIKTLKNKIDLTYLYNLKDDEIKKECREIARYFSYFSIIFNENWKQNFIDTVDWVDVSNECYWMFSKDFIREFKEYLHWGYIFYKCSDKIEEDLIEEYFDKIPSDYWLYKSKEFKIDYIEKYTNYEIRKDNRGEYLLVYKGVYRDNQSFYDPHVYYCVGETYNICGFCNYDSNIKNGEGFSVCDKESAIEFAKKYNVHNNYNILQVRVYIDDIATITKNEKTIRCTKFEVIKKLKEKKNV